MRYFSFAGLALAVALGGCDGGSDGAETRARSVKPANEYVDQLNGLSELNRGLALRRAVQDTGQNCKKVESSAYQEDYKNLSVWNLRCSDAEYALFIAPNGDVQVRSCTEVTQLGLPECQFGEAATKEAATKS